MAVSCHCFVGGPICPKARAGTVRKSKRRCSSRWINGGKMQPREDSVYKIGMSRAGLTGLLVGIAGAATSVRVESLSFWPNFSGPVLGVHMLPIRVIDAPQ